MAANVKPHRREHRHRPAPMILPDDLYDYAEDRPHRCRGPRALDDDRSAVPSIVVTDDWPESIPVTEAEVDIFERYFGDVVDTLFGTPRS